MMNLFRKLILESKQEGFYGEFCNYHCETVWKRRTYSWQMLAKRLGVPFYGKEIIQMASDESGIDVKLFGQVEEGTKVKASLFNKTGLYKGALIAPDQKGFISDENIFNYQAKVVNDLAEKEPCVIVDDA